MDPNTHSNDRPTERPTDRPTERPAGGHAGRSEELATLAAAVDGLAAQDLDRLTDAALARQVLELRRLVDRLEGHWLQRLAAVDGRGAAGAELEQPAASTASWLRGRLRMGAGAASSSVRTARALFRGPLATSAAALTAGAISPAHAQVLAAGTHDLPNHITSEAEPVLLAAARRLDPPRLRQAVGHLVQVADPEAAEDQAERRHQRRGVWVSATWEGMVALDGLLEPEAGQTLLAALEPLARPADAQDQRSGGQRTADALTELARRALEGGRLPQTGGVRPQLTVTVDLDSLLGHPGAVGGEVGGAGPVDPEACRRLACDSTVTRVIVTRQPNHQISDPHPELIDPHPDLGHSDNGADLASVTEAPCETAGLAGRLAAAMTRLPPILGGAPTQPLEVGRTTRVIQPAQRTALAVRDRGCSFPSCDRPLAWCEAHHLRHWLHGGPTDLANLALLCRAHHRAVHEGGWRVGRDPDGHLVATPPHRRRRAVASHRPRDLVTS